MDLGALLMWMFSQEAEGYSEPAPAEHVDTTYEGARNPATGSTRTPPATPGGGAGYTQPGGYRRI